MNTGRKKSMSPWEVAVAFSVVVISSLVVMAGCTSSAKNQPSLQVKSAKKPMITLEQLESMFARMRDNPQLNTDGELLWGYFFTDPDPKKLERLVDPLTRDGYRFGRIYETDDKTTHFLHVEKIEKHTPQTLNSRNAEFYRLAEEYGLESYDGMDVGPILEN